MFPLTSKKDSLEAEYAFLDREAAQALGDLRRGVCSMAKDARAAVSLGGWTREHPWGLLGASAIACFSAAFGLGAALRKEPARSASAAVERQSSQEELPAARPPAPGPDQTRAARGGSSIWHAAVRIASFLARTGFRIVALACVRPAAGGPLAAASMTGQQPGEARGSSDGRNGPESSGSP